jgi:DNA-3-methyladenine glycosylase II
MNNFDVIMGDVSHLLKTDSVFQSAFPQGTAIKQSWGEPTMAGLIRIVIGQQISNKVAQNLWTKFKADIDPNNPDEILAAGEDQLKSYGLSRQKIGYVRGLAQAVKDTKIDVASWIHADDEYVRQQILSLKGFGPWSAQVFMLFHLCHRHIWPAGDLGIQIGLQKYLGLADRPNEKETENHRHLFEGRESAAALLLWELKGDKLTP